MLKSFQIFKESKQISRPWIYEGDFKVTEDMVKNGKMIKEKIPDKVIGDFYCYNNQLTSLEGCPSSVSGNFDCFNNQLSSLEGCPINVGGIFYYSNNLQDLTIEKNFIKSGRCSSKENYWKDLFQYMIDEKIDLNKVKSWPDKFIETMDDQYKNLLKSYKNINKYNL